MLATQLARYMISFSWLYHGFFPKLFHVAPLEKIMTANFGFAEDISLRITQTAGVAEMLFGIVFFIFYQVRAVVLLNIMTLTGLLLFVAVLQPDLLIEAFNPVTTNLPLIALSIVLLQQQANSNNQHP